MLIQSIEHLLEDELKGLNPKLWKGEKLIPAVRNHLLRIATDFVSGLDESPDVKDIVFCGSNASSNWSSSSDIDVHIVIDFDTAKDPLAYYDYLGDAGALWNDHHDIQIKRLPVEIYIQKFSEPPFSNGVFSLKDNEWLKKPAPLGVPAPQDLVMRKMETFKRRIEKIIHQNEMGHYEKAMNNARKLREQIRLYRQAGLSERGELSAENLAFKALRNAGLIDQLRNVDRQAYDKLMSLPEHQERSAI